MGWPLRLFLLTVIFGPPATAAVLMIDGVPTVPRPGAISMKDLEKARTLAERYDPGRMASDRVTALTATADELNTLLKGTLGTTGRLASRVEIAETRVTVSATVELQAPKNPIGRFVNIRGDIAPSEQGLKVSRLVVGSVDIPALLIRPAMNYGLRDLLGDEAVEAFLDSVASVKIADRAVTVAFRPPAGRASDPVRKTPRPGVVSRPGMVRAYYDTIERTVSRLPRGGRTSLVEIMRPVFGLARERSTAGDPVRENEAAMLAVAIYFGDPRFERFVGEVRTAEQKRTHKRATHILLDGRHDFVQHFAISVGLVLTGGDMAANILGELKETEDSRKSSGFSFTDIGADRAGVQFAKRAMADRATALRMQRILSEARDERVFFPRFADLPDGLKRAVFEKRYGDVGSTAYNRVIAEIDRRIAQTQAFR